MELDDAEKTRDNVVISIEEKLQNMPHIVEECSIYRVPKWLLDMNYNAYVPKVISIGPFHHGQHNFMITEELKLRFFSSYRSRVVDMFNIQDIAEKAQSWERRARKYYSEPINMDNEEFLKMMILDGCFIVEFLIMDLTDLFPNNENKVHSSFYNALDSTICMDLIMLENQLPLFVLQDLYDLIIFSTSNDTSSSNIQLFEQVVHSFLNDHVLPITSVGLSKNMLNQKPRHLVDFLKFYFVPLKNKNIVVDQNKCLPPTATQLSEAGVIFKKVEKDETCIMDISFKNGILYIPPILIDDAFETCARNILAFTQFSCDQEIIEDINENAIHYFEFLDELITTEKDVNLLVKEGIIINHIGGSDKETSQLFNDICKNITVRSTNCFSDIAKDLKQHCERRRNRWMASLRHNYFNTPWALISFLAATFLILLTILQTIFSGISTYK